MSKYKLRGEFSKDFWEKLATEKLTNIIRYASDPANGLDIQLRGNYINIYYKGGNALEIKPRSFDFDKFYFYYDCKKSDIATRKSVILNASKGAPDYIKLISETKAKDIIRVLDQQQKELLRLIEESPELYFNKAKSVIDKWLEVQWVELGIQHNEKATQHQISLHNKNFSNTDLVVIDLEYAISQKASFAELNGNPRPDIVAVDKEGRIHVLELKYKFQATEGDAGVQVHIEDFDKTIGKDIKGDFVAEMKQLVKSKQRLGLIDENCFVNLDQKPCFDLVFKGTEQDVAEFERIYGHYVTEKKVNKIYYLIENEDYRLK